MMKSKNRRDPFRNPPPGGQPIISHRSTRQSRLNNQNVCIERGSLWKRDRRYVLRHYRICL